MKILQIGKFYPIRGGVEKVMYDLMVGLSEKQIYCDMLCATIEDQKPGIIQINPYGRLICVKTLRKVAATTIAPAMISTLRRIKNDYDIIHVHHPDPMACLALFLSGYKGKVILHWHSDILKQKAFLKLYSPLQKWLIKRADLILGTTPVYVRESPYLRRYQQKVDYLPIGIDPIEVDNDKVLTIRNRFKHKKIIFSLGRLVEYKGYEYLVKAAQFLSDEYVILIGGTGPLKDSLNELIRSLKVEKRVQLLGYVSDEDVSTYFGACDLFCLTSIMKTEAFAIVQIEAMSCGKPVVSTRIPGSGVSWVNQDGVSGLTVDICDEKAIAKSIETILSEDEKNDFFSHESRKRFDSLFSRSIMVGKYCEFGKILLKR